MSTFQYTITKFNNATKTLDVSFGIDGGYAKINLMAPLPKNVVELEAIIKQYVLPQEYIDAINSPVDMSYVTPLVGNTRQCERRSINSGVPNQNANQNWDVDNPYSENNEPDVQAAQDEFEQAVLAVLKQKGLVK